MTSGDLPQLVSIQALCYPAGYLESEGVLRARFAQAPDTAWVATMAGQVHGYLVAYRSRLQSVTPLGAMFVPSLQPDTLYLHDLAVVPAAAGQGVGPRLVQAALVAAGDNGLRHAALVAVQDAAPFWRRQGFQPASLECTCATAALASYGRDARYMTRTVGEVDRSD